MGILECAPTVEKSTEDISPKPGYIPVYIRNGNTPLEEINSDLAEAFDSYAYKHYKLDYGKLNNRLIGEDRKNEENLIIDKDDLEKITRKRNVQRTPRA